jgi:hypothetical protein
MNNPNFEKKIPTDRLTILTDPIPYGKDFFRFLFKILLIKARNILYSFIGKKVQKYRGHHAVTRSLIEGLEKNNKKFFYNPISFNQITDTVVVLSGPHTLEQCIEFKKKGIIKKIFAGPNIVIFSSDKNNLIAAKEVDCVITPSEIINQLYLEDNPSLKNRIVSWPAGVNTEFWKPKFANRREKILIYEKQIKGPVGPVQPYASYIISKGYDVHIIQYGNYDYTEYLHHLQESILMVGFVTDESQGIAWAEAWSCDVPILVWNNHTNIYNGRTYHCTPAPYLTKENGLFFDDFDDFVLKFNEWEQGKYQFSPRKWCKDNMSDEACAKKLINIIEKC